MARAREIEGLDGGVPFARAAAQVVEVRAAELFEHAAGVLDVQDIERVHDMRVATRRLRAVLEIFASCFPKRAHRPVLKDVKALADALGERRDPDVQLDALRRYAEAVPAGDQPGIDVLVSRLRARQAGANADLAVALAEMERSDLRGRLRALVEEARTR
ncbi:MAG: exopolyphosphatase / guanosine-5-triphosphate,3-diphosphate pyrophosphatase [Solirubrobacteraceae bacterium]|jgi:CHAD domain-containing protein|nr:exopolyphosphatase / guanosine-5-triphosphate,3-diphosphate pyrophosphatase [Solirubrobacteraceae bacterium]